jgi:hypothetical protein
MNQVSKPPITQKEMDQLLDAVPKVGNQVLTEEEINTLLGAITVKDPAESEKEYTENDIWNDIIYNVKDEKLQKILNGLLVVHNDLKSEVKWLKQELVNKNAREQKFKEQINSFSLPD